MLADLLIVEDSRIIGHLVQSFADGLGCGCDHVTNGLDALAAAQTKQYDLIFMDCHIPHMDGFETAQRVRSADGPNRTTPIIAISGSEKDATVSKALAAGMNGTLIKPFDLNEFRSTLEHWLGLHISHGGQRPPDENAVSSWAAAMGPDVDLTRLRKITDGTETGVLELLREYMSEMSGTLLFLNEVIKTQDFETITIAAHKAVGSSRFCGLNGLGSIFDRLEAAAEHRDISQIANVVREASSAHALLADSLRKIRPPA